MDILAQMIARIAVIDRCVMNKDEELKIEERLEQLSNQVARQAHNNERDVFTVLVVVAIVLLVYMCLATAGVLQ